MSYPAGLNQLATDLDRVAFLEAEILEAARLLSLKGKRSGLATEIRKLAAEHLRLQLESATHVRAIDGDCFAEIGELISIERMQATVLFPSGARKISLFLLRVEDQQ